MSYGRRKVVPSSRHCDGERAVAECRVSMWRSDGQRLCPTQTSSILAMEVGTPSPASTHLKVN